MTQTNWAQTFERDRVLREFCEFLSIPSISADSAYHPQCKQAADWLVAQITQCGLAARLLPTSGLPVVFAEYRGAPNKPTLVFYGHYDVQPAERTDGWESDPFTAEVKGDRLYARGASDDKGPVFFFIKALETLVAAKKLDCTVRLFIEGEEESGSQGIAGKAQEWSELLSGDALLVLDTGTTPSGTPAITLGLRGIASLTATLSGPNRDLHSGVHGGLAPNPALEMARLVAKLHDGDRKIAIPGYYEGIKPLSAELRTVVEEAQFSAEKYREKTGIDPVGGERGLQPLERVWLRPTIEVNGIHSGYGGPGSKTIIPMSAMSKLTTRLVGGQDPDRCLKLIEDFLNANRPDGLKLEITEQKTHGAALLLDPRANWVQRAKQVLDKVTPGGGAFTVEGASIPIIPALAEAGGLEPILVGYGQDEDRIHGANESVSLTSFERGYIFSCAFLDELSR